MLFTIRRQGRLAQSLGDPASGISSGWRRRAGVFVITASILSCLPMSVANAQSSQGTTLTPAQILNGFGTNSPSVSATPQPAAPASTEEQTDPVSRFLADKGLLPSTKPVVELAQQMRDKATDMASDLVLSAMNFLGVPYRRGGSSQESGFDCSGFTRHVFENSVGLILPRRASEQANSPDLVPVQKSELKPGDLVFFNTLRHTFSHVGIYIGDDKFIHSPRAGGQVRVEDMRQAYWQQRFDGARRAPTISARQSKSSGNN
jgi:cell wall-associated NlpC family hydrolase